MAAGSLHRPRFSRLWGGVRLDRPPLFVGSFLCPNYFSFQISVVAKDLFGRLLSGGVTVYLAMHIIVNIGMMTGFLPITGVPLVACHIWGLFGTLHHDGPRDSPKYLRKKVHVLMQHLFLFKEGKWIGEGRSRFPSLRTISAFIPVGAPHRLKRGLRYSGYRKWRCMGAMTSGKPLCDYPSDRNDLLYFT